MDALKIDGYERITKHAARARHNSGLACYVLPHKMRPGNMWMNPAPVPVYEPQGRTFAEFVNEYEGYNCNHELGYYAAFYKREGVQ